MSVSFTPETYARHKRNGEATSELPVLPSPSKKSVEARLWPGSCLCLARRSGWLDLIRRIIKDDPVAADLLDKATQTAHGGDRKSVGSFKLHNIQLDPVAPTGTSEAAALRRLRKSAPKLHAKVLAGDILAVSAAIPLLCLRSRAEARIRNAPECVFRFVRRLEERNKLDCRCLRNINNHRHCKSGNLAVI